MKEPRSTPPTPVAIERRRWVRPRVQSTASLVGPVLLCSTGAPFVCEGGACCDIASDCRSLCNGG